ncbi:MAG: hypothetical protein R2747_23445 [Pyrinomonadaceae bacterium]
MKGFRFFILVFLLTLGFSGAEAQTAYQLAVLQRSIEPLYRKPTKDELAAIAPNPRLFKKYSSFLDQSDTGLTRLVADSGCADNTKVIVATEDCMKYTMPGAGYSYSFRIDNYRLPRLADLVFTDNSFQASGVLLHGILVNIGDVPLEKVTLKTKGLKYLINFQPVTDYDRAKEIDQELTAGIIEDGFIYRRGLYAVEDATFVLRSIAYKGANYRAVQGITYNELDFDKRRDIIVAFRIVEKGEDGSITILWKELDRKDSPEMKGTRKYERL